MTSLFSAARAAEEFDQVLAGTATAAVADRHAELLDTVTLLRAQPEVLPRAAFVVDLRSRLMTAAATELVTASPVVGQLAPARRARNSRLGAAAAALVIVGGTAGTAAAASGSLPGEALYPVKRGVERADVAVHLGDAGKGKVLLDQAATRLDEVRALRSQGSADPRLISTALDAFDEAAEAGSDKLFRAYQTDGEGQDIVSVRSFTTDQMDAIASLSQGSKATDGDLVDAADTVADIDQQARVLCAACSDAGALTPPKALAAGAAGTTVNHLLTRPVAQVQTDLDRAQVERRDRIRLQAAAQTAAGATPTAQQPAPAAAPAAAQAAAQAAATGGGTSGDGTTGTPSRPVASTLTKEGTLVPALTPGTTSTGAAVKDLVSGLTTTLESPTKSATGDKSPLDPVIEGATNGVPNGVTNGVTNGATNGATNGVNDTLNGLLPGAPGN